MCILKIYSQTDSFESFSKKALIPLFSLKNKSELQSQNYRISFDVSDKEWDDIKGQINDTILFLKKYYFQIQELMDSNSISDAYLDFPIWSRLEGDVVNQNDHFPRELITLAGKLNLGIEVGIYSKDAFD